MERDGGEGRELDSEELQKRSCLLRLPVESSPQGQRCQQPGLRAVTPEATGIRVLTPQDLHPGSSTKGATAVASSCLLPRLLPCSTLKSSPLPAAHDSYPGEGGGKIEHTTGQCFQTMSFYPLRNH